MDATAAKRKLSELRSTLSEEQRLVLTAIRDYERLANKSMPVRDLLSQTAMDQSELLVILRPLGGSVVTWKTSSGPGFELTFPGVLLLPDGEKVEDAVSRTIANMKRRSLNDTQLQHVRLSDLQQELELAPIELPFLQEALSTTRFLNVGMSDGESVVQFPYDIDTLSRNATSDDFHNYVLQKAFEYFTDGLPVKEHEQQLYLSGLKRSEQTKTVFWFVRDERLRHWLASDWQEAQRVLGVNAFRSCAILCGSILEGLLLDALSDQEEQARKVLQGKKAEKSKTGEAGMPGRLTGWDLAEFLEVAEELKVLGETNLTIGSAVRDYRNLVHLGRQLRKSQEVTPDAAGIAIRAVAECLRALDYHARRK